MDEKQEIAKFVDFLNKWKDGYPSVIELPVITFWTNAFKMGQESILKATEELVYGAAVFDLERALEAARGRQATETLAILREWMAIDPEKNRYDVSESGLFDDGKKYRVTVWRSPRFLNDINYHNFYGDSDMAALADAAQSVVAEVEEARKKK